MPDYRAAWWKVHLPGDRSVSAHCSPSQTEPSHEAARCSLAARSRAARPAFARDFSGSILSPAPNPSFQIDDADHVLSAAVRPARARLVTASRQEADRPSSNARPASKPQLTAYSPGWKHQDASSLQPTSLVWKRSSWRPCRSGRAPFPGPVGRAVESARDALSPPVASSRARRSISRAIFSGPHCGGRAASPARRPCSR